MKKMKWALIAGAAALSMSVVVFSGCKKKGAGSDPLAPSANTGSVDGDYAYDQALAERLLEDAEALADMAMESPRAEGAFKKSGCAVITSDTGKLMVEFGPTNCACYGGRVRRGRIEVVYKGNYWDSGTVLTLTFSSYYQNDHKIEGSKVITRMGENEYGEAFAKSHSEVTIFKPDNTPIAINWDRVRTLRSGPQTPTTRWDDIYLLTGSGNITRSGGTVNFAIIRPLEIHNNCHWIEKGLIAYTLNTGEQRTLNYGDVATCDNDGVIDAPDGTKKIIKLPL